MRYVQITGSDIRLDSMDVFESTLNPLPKKCDQCGFPDIDAISQPYKLIKARTWVPDEVAQAGMGNFLIRPRIRKVLDIVAPNECDYFPTVDAKELQPTPWILAVPKHQFTTGQVVEKIKRCDVCNEPRSAHPGTQYTKDNFRPPSETEGAKPEFEIFKSRNWASSEYGWKSWIDRDLELSIRLLGLLKSINAKGIVEATCDSPTPPDADDEAWIQDKLAQLKEAGITLHPDTTSSPADLKWLQDYVKRHTQDDGPAIDIHAVESQHNVKLPTSYSDFMTKVGPTTFHNLDEQEGFEAHILAPDKMNFDEYRLGAIEEIEDADSLEVDGVMFATTDHGDVFCFDVQADQPEYPVVLYNHDYNCYEPYAENFAVCIRRFAENNITEGE